MNRVIVKKFIDRVKSLDLIKDEIGWDAYDEFKGAVYKCNDELKVFGAQLGPYFLYVEEQISIGTSTTALEHNRQVLLLSVTILYMGSISSSS